MIVHVLVDVSNGGTITQVKIQGAMKVLKTALDLIIKVGSLQTRLNPETCTLRVEPGYAERWGKMSRNATEILRAKITTTLQSDNVYCSILLTCTRKHKALA